MPKAGYTCITISETLKEQLKSIAKDQNCSIPRLLKTWCTSTVLVPNARTKTPNQACFEKLVAGGVGFEPTTTSLGGLRPILARLPALRYD